MAGWSLRNLAAFTHPFVHELEHLTLSCSFELGPQGLKICEDGVRLVLVWECRRSRPGSLRAPVEAAIAKLGHLVARAGLRCWMRESSKAHES